MRDGIHGDWVEDLRRDPRSVDELITAALCEPDEERAWDAVCVLHARGGQEILDRAVQLCGSDCAVERRVGADILGQLGIPDRTFPELCLRVLLSMLEREDHDEVLRAILVALSHLRRPESIAPAARFQSHSDPDVRHAVVLVMIGQDDPLAIRTLIELARDSAVRVRDWATYALGTQTEADTPQLREALVDRLSDEDDETRGEALVGLAQRKDRRVLPTLSKELAADWVGTLAVEAAALIGEPRLHPLLVDLLDCWDVNEDLLREAIEACSPTPGLTAPGPCEKVG